MGTKKVSLLVTLSTWLVKIDSTAIDNNVMYLILLEDNVVLME